MQRWALKRPIVSNRAVYTKKEGGYASLFLYHFPHKIIPLASFVNLCYTIP